MTEQTIEEVMNLPMMVRHGASNTSDGDHQVRECCLILRDGSVEGLGRGGAEPSIVARRAEGWRWSCDSATIRCRVQER